MKDADTNEPGHTIRASTLDRRGHVTRAEIPARRAIDDPARISNELRGARRAAQKSLRYSPHVNIPSGDGWPDWQRDYRYGVLVIEPPPELAAVLDPIRERFDPVSAARVGAHITVTPPFAGAPTPADEARVGSVVRRVPSMSLQLGRPRQFSGSSVIYLPVVNAGAVMRLREVLLATGLFRLDLPHTTDFVPHLTISEFGTTPAAALRTVIPAPGASAFHVGAIAWVVPDERFQFRVRRSFALA